MLKLLVSIALALPQTTPTGGAIAGLVPPLPTPASFISDEKGVLSAADRATLDARIRSVQDAGLGDIAVAILPSVGGYSPNQVSVEIYRTWKVGRVAAIGSAQRNVGVLLLIVPKELAPDNRGHCWINTGTGAEGMITDATAGTICRDSVIPHLRDRDYAGAVGAAITAIEGRLRGDEMLVAAAADLSDDGQSSRSHGIPLGLGGLAVLVAGVVGTRRWMRYRRRKCSRCGQKMKLLDEKSDDARLKREEALEEKLGSIDYDVWACACGGSAVIPYRAFFTKYGDCRTCKRRTASSKRKEIVAATTAASGLAEDRFTCKSCGAKWTEKITIPRISESSSSSGGGSSGGSSFGGSGSTSGGGGGGSY